VPPWSVSFIPEIGIVLSDSGHLACVFSNLVALFSQKQNQHFAKPESLIDRAVARSISLNLKDIPALLACRLGGAHMAAFLPCVSFRAIFTSDLRFRFRNKHHINIYQ